MQRKDKTIRSTVETYDIEALNDLLKQNIKNNDNDDEKFILETAATKFLNANGNQIENAKAIFNKLIEHGYAANPEACAKVLKAITFFQNEPLERQKIIAEFIVKNFPVDWSVVFNHSNDFINMFVNHRAILKILFAHGKSVLVDRPFKNGLTLLQLIAKKDSLVLVYSKEILEILFNSNVKPTIRDYDDNLTAYQMARLAKNHDTAEAIKDYTNRKYKGVISPTDTIENQDRELKGSPIQLPQQPRSNYKIEAKYLIPGNDLSMGAILGKGGFGTVYQGTWKSYNHVAIKMLNVDNSESAIHSFIKEAILFLSLRHPNVLSMYGLCDQPQLGIVMEYASRGSLFNVLHTNNDLEWDDRIKLARGSARGLQYLHDKNIMHRDLKSANVLVSDTGEAKLTDFGLSVVSTTNTSQSIPQAVGTLAWMGPELFTEQPTYTLAADIYSFGIILWEIATREIPWKNTGAGSLVGAVMKGERPAKELPAETPAIYKQYMKLCWFQEPEKRPTISEVVESLESCRP